MKIAFDINGTLIRENKSEAGTIKEFLKILKNAGHHIMVWTTQSVGYAQNIVNELEITDYVDEVISKVEIDSDSMPDVAFDDNEFTLSNQATIKV